MLSLYKKESKDMLCYDYYFDEIEKMALPKPKPNGNNMNNKASMDEISVVLTKFGDEQSTLLDQFERLSFEVQLNQAILGRSLSEPSVKKKRTTLQSQFQFQAPPAAEPQVVVQRKGRRGSGFNRVLKKLLKPILGRKGRKPVAEAEAEADPIINPMSRKAFSRSLRL